MKAAVVILAASFAAIPFASAQQVPDSLARDSAAQRLERVVVTSSRRAQRLKDSPVSVEVIARDEIRRSGASDLASLLVERTGIDLQGGHPAGEGVMLQGIGSERVLILLDGQPLAGRISGVSDISRIPTSVVQQIEIVKGPQSTLYGSEAMGGVINVVTRGPIPGLHSATASIVTGSDGRRDASAGGSLSLGRLGVGADFGHRRVDRAPGRGVTTGAFAERFDYASKLAWRQSDNWTVSTSLFALSERQRWQTGPAYLFADNTQWSARAAASYTRGPHRITPGIYISDFENLSRGSDQQKPYAADPGDRQVQRIIEGELLYSGTFGASLVDGGLEIRRDETVSDRVIGGARHTTTWEPFAQVEVPVGRVAWVPGARVSVSDQWGTHISPRLAFRSPLPGAGTLRASASRGFRAPDFKEQFMFFQNASAGYTVRGNPDLRPETSLNTSLGAEVGRGPFSGRAQLFWNEFDQFIETRVVSAPSEPPVYEYANVDDGSTRGLELEGSVLVRAVRLESSLALLSTRDHATGESLLGRPSRTGRLAASASAPLGFDLSVALAYTGSATIGRADLASGTPALTRGSYTRTDVRIARGFGDVELSAGADNLFDARPREWPGFVGRQIYAGVSWSALIPAGSGR